MSDLTLRPCPFCGGDVYLRKALWPAEGDTDSIVHTAPDRRWPHGCPLLVFDDGTNDQSIIEKWNRCASDPAREQKIAEVIAALQQIADMIAGCHDATRRASLPQMVLHVARAALAAFEEGR